MDYDTPESLTRVQQSEHVSNEMALTGGGRSGNIFLLCARLLGCHDVDTFQLVGDRHESIQSNREREYSHGKTRNGITIMTLIAVKVVMHSLFPGARVETKVYSC